MQFSTNLKGMKSQRICFYKTSREAISLLLPSLSNYIELFFPFSTILPISYAGRWSNMASHDPGRLPGLDAGNNTSFYLKELEIEKQTESKAKRNKD